jgi:hypothetical protein
MPRPILTILLAIITLQVTAQTRVRSLGELMDTSGHAWNTVKKWIDSAKNPVTVLPVDSAISKDCLFKLQLTSSSTLGTVICHTGGIVVDSGRIRLLGGGAKQTKRDVAEWNFGKSYTQYGQKPGFLLVADDAVGGFFAINCGSLGKDFGKMYYLSPFNLEWEQMDMTYNEFLLFCFYGKLDKFYKKYAWPGSSGDFARLHFDRTYCFFPLLFTKEGKKDLSKNLRKVIPVEQLYCFYLDMRIQLRKK